MCIECHLKQGVSGGSLPEKRMKRRRGQIAMMRAGSQEK